MAETVLIERRYRGPAESGNGGYTCGIVAALVGDEAEVTVRVPPPLERALRIERADGGVRVLDGETLVAEARRLPLELAAAEPVPHALAVERAAALADDPNHPFPSCFVCGPGRAPGDALRLRPAQVGDGRVAAPWTPTPELAGRPELVWAALDCPGAFAIDPHLERGVSVLGRLHARVLGTPEAGEDCVVVGWPLEEDGRKRFAGTALFGDGARLLGLGRATWILIAS